MLITSTVLEPLEHAADNCKFYFSVIGLKKLCIDYQDLIGITNSEMLIKQYNDFKFL